MYVTIPLEVQIAPTDPGRDDEYASLRAKASLAMVTAGGGDGFEQLSVAQAAVVLIEHEVSLSTALPTVEGWAFNGSWDALVTEDDPALPVPHHAEFQQSDHQVAGYVAKVRGYGWVCACGESVSCEYATQDFAKRSHAEHVKTTKATGH